MKNVLEEEIQKAQTQFERARKRNIQLKTALAAETSPEREEREQSGNEEAAISPPSLIHSQSPSPPPFPGPIHQSHGDSPSSFSHGEDSFKDRSFSPEPGLIDHIVSHSGEGDTPTPQTSPPVTDVPYPGEDLSGEYHVYGGAPMYPPPPPQYYYPYAQQAPQAGFLPPQFDMQGYARQMVEFFQQYLPPATTSSKSPPSYSHISELEEELQSLQLRYTATEEELIQTQRERDRAVAFAASAGANAMPEVVEELRGRLEDSTAKVESLGKALAKETEAKASAERRLESAKSRIARMETTVEELKQELRCLHEEHTRVTKDLTMQGKKAQKEADTLRTEVNILRSQKDKLTIERAELSSELRSQPVASSLEFYSTSMHDTVPRRSTVSHDTRPALSDPLSVSQPGLLSCRNARSQETSFGFESSEGNRTEDVKSVENELMKIQLEKDMALVEFNKIPEHNKTISQRRRREALEKELDEYNVQINSLKRKLRTMTGRRA